ncbi:MAG: Rossmann-like and DUF2520 domain-containing protein [Syntrophothermus sp.]
MIRKIVMIGAGRLATRLSIDLKEKGYSIAQVYNRTPENGSRLAEQLESGYTSDLKSLARAELYIISVADHALEEVAGQIENMKGIVVHTSGTMGLNTLRNCSETTGVLYLPQTFTFSAPMDLKGIPVCVEGSDPRTENELFEIGERISGKVYRISSEQRAWLHLSATFVSNFPNFLYAAAEKIMNQSNLNMEMLVPLIMETAAHSRTKDIFASQTGPAIREDQPVIDKHLALLQKFPEYREIYQLITNSIINQKHGNDEL